MAAAMIIAMHMLYGSSSTKGVSLSGVPLMARDFNFAEAAKERGLLWKLCDPDPEIPVLLGLRTWVKVTDEVSAPPFQSTLTTKTLNLSSLTWFGTCPYQPIPRDLPSSLMQLIVTHCHTHGIQKERRFLPGLNAEVSALTIR